jgi:hypothetical protein
MSPLTRVCACPIIPDKLMIYQHRSGVRYVSAEEDSLPCSLGNLCAMHQIQDPVPFHPHQHKAGAEAIGQVSSASTWNRNDKA